MSTPGAPLPASVAGGVGGVVIKVAARHAVAWGRGDLLLAEIAESAVAELAESGAARKLPGTRAARDKRERQDEGDCMYNKGIRQL